MPLVANIVEGGKTPQLPAAELYDLGFTVVLFANFLMRVMAKAGLDTLADLRGSGDTRGHSERMVPQRPAASRPAAGSLAGPRPARQADAGW